LIASDAPIGMFIVPPAMVSVFVPLIVQTAAAPAATSNFATLKLAGLSTVIPPAPTVTVPPVTV